MKALLKPTQPLQLLLAAAFLFSGITALEAQEKPASQSASSTGVSAKPKTTSPALPMCGTASVQTPTPASQHHKVVLSWKAGSPALTPDYEAVGYCVYRSTKQNDLAPDLINSTAFSGTSCTDDLVSDNLTYYYIVRAISAKGRKSPFSKDTTALIPNNAPASSAGNTSAPLCRTSSTAP